MNERARNAYIAAQAETRRRAAKPYDCTRCDAPCLRGDDHDKTCLTATVDAEPVDGPVGEMLARIDGRSTYDLIRGDLWRREPWHTRTDRPIYADHRCQKGKTCPTLF